MLIWLDLPKRVVRWKKEKMKKMNPTKQICTFIKHVLTYGLKNDLAITSLWADSSVDTLIFILLFTKKKKQKKKKNKKKQDLKFHVDCLNWRHWRQFA